MNCLPANSAPQAYLFQTTNALSQITQNAYYSCTGLLLWKRDQNDFNAARVGPSFNYDLMNRPTSVIYPDGGRTIFNYSDVPPVYSVVSKYIDATNSTNFYDQLDDLGREFRTATANGEPSPNIFDLEEICYDNLGRKSFVSYPYPGQGFVAPHFCSGTGDAFAYDALSRPTSVTNSDGSVVTTSYSGNWTTVCDQAGRCRKSATDALGRLTTVCEPDPATGVLPTGPACTYETDYQYDTLDNLTRVDQKGNDPNSANWRTRTFTYDSFSRLLSATNPESGTISYSYDNDGNLISKTAPAPNQTGTATVTTSYSYDALHRLGYKSYSN